MQQTHHLLMARGLNGEDVRARTFCGFPGAKSACPKHRDLCSKHLAHCNPGRYRVSHTKMCKGNEEIMPHFIVNKSAQPDSDDNEVHDVASTYDCLPAVENQVDLGVHASCSGAVNAAKVLYPNADGCRWCASACHTS